MVAQQLTPELTQPNVLVEIDPGPPMRLRQEAQRSTSTRELDQMTESWSIIFDASGPDGLQTIEFDECLARRIANGGTTACIEVESDGTEVEVLEGECTENSGELLTSRRIANGGTTACIEVESDGTKVEVLEGECTENSGELLTSRRPRAIPCAHCATQPQKEEETVFVGMHHLKFMNNGNEQGAREYSIDKSSSLGWSHPEEVRLRTFDEPATAVVPSLLGPASPASPPSEPLTGVRRSLDRGSVTGWPYPLGHPRSLMFPLDQREELVPKCGLEDHCFNSHGNSDNGFVILDKRVAEYPQDSVYGGVPQTTCRCDLALGGSRSGRSKESRSTGRTVTSDVEPPFPMSWAAGSKTSFSVDTEEFVREVLVWIVHQNVMTSQCGRQSPLRLLVQATELLLDLVAAAISCIRIPFPSGVPENARVKQCTQEVHCLLEDPG